MSSSALLKFSLISALSACAGHRVGGSETAHRIGCYTVRSAGVDTVKVWFPDTIALLSSRSKDEVIADLYGTRLNDRDAKNMSLLAFGWRPLATDSLRIVGTSGFFGVEFEGRFTDEGFEGSTASFTDVIDNEPIPRHRIIGTRARCLGFAARAA